MAQCEDSDGAGCRPCYREPFFLSELNRSTFQLFSQRELQMTFQPNRLIATIGCLVVALLFLSQDAAAQYYYPANNYGWSYGSQPTTQYYSAPSTSRYRSTPRPVSGYGSNLHRNFTIRQEQLRSQRTGLPPRRRGNVRWFR